MCARAEAVERVGGWVVERLLNRGYREQGLWKWRDYETEREIRLHTHSHTYLVWEI